MRPIQIIFSLFISFFSFLYVGVSWGYTKIGNGGFVVVCPRADSYDMTVEVLDVYEGVTFSCEPVNYSDKFDEWSKANDLALRAMEIQVDPSRLRGYIDRIKKNLIFKRISATHNRDVGVISGIGNCLIYQAAMQTGSREKRQYFFDPGLWYNSLSIDQKSALIIHEALYSYFLDDNIYLPNSELIRKKTYALLIAPIKF